jgi:hypothetical protein
MYNWSWDGGGKCSEIVPNNKVIQHLVKELIYSKTGNNQKLKIEKIPCMFMGLIYFFNLYMLLISNIYICLIN